MATLNVTLDNICSGGGHIRLTSTVNAGSPRVINLETDNIMTAVTDDDIERFMRVLLKIHAIGKTKLQLRNSLTSGLVITI